MEVRKVNGRRSFTRLPPEYIRLLKDAVQDKTLFFRPGMGLIMEDSCLTSLCGLSDLEVAVQDLCPWEDPQRLLVSRESLSSQPEQKTKRSGNTSEASASASGSKVSSLVKHALDSISSGEPAEAKDAVLELAASLTVSTCVSFA
jgi:hypothetical protein